MILHAQPCPTFATASCSVLSTSGDAQHDADGDSPDDDDDDELLDADMTGTIKMNPVFCYHSAKLSPCSIGNGLVVETRTVSAFLSLVHTQLEASHSVRIRLNHV